MSSEVVVVVDKLKQGEIILNKIVIGLNKVNGF